MVGKTIMTWMVEQGRTPVYLARQAGLNTEILADLIAGRLRPRCKA